MTIKKFLENAYIKEFNANVEAITTFEGKSAIVLDETYFYPLGGGQPGDIGRIGNYTIVDTQIKDGIIYHLTQEESVTVEGQVSCEIDFDRRFHYMQQHAGQHILSACAIKRFDAATVGFHIGYDYVTIDLDYKMSEDALKALVLDANKVITNNLKIIAHYPSPEALAQMPLRKTPKVTKDIRVIEVEGFDFSPCGGTHPLTTGEIGCLFVKKMENYKNGVRLEFSCGQQAVKDMMLRNDIVNTLLAHFSVPAEDIIDMAKSQTDLLKGLKKQVADLETKCLAFEVEALIEEVNQSKEAYYVIQSLDTPMNTLRQKVQTLSNASPKLIIGLANEAGKNHIVLGQSSGEKPLNQVFKQLPSNLAVRGGGSPKLIQGGFEKWEQAETLLTEVLKIYASL